MTWILKVALGLALFVVPASIYAAPIDSPDVTVSAYVGIMPTPTKIPTGGRFSLFGYTSPQAKVSINNPGMYSDTIADNSGYFEFLNFFSQLLVEDICLTAEDSFGRVTMPVCIPPIPSEESQSIGPVIMPPTISINNDNFFTGDSITITGKTTPDTQIQLSLFTDELKTSYRALYQDKNISFQKKLLSSLLYINRSINPVRITHAMTLPKRDISVNATGDFTLKLSSEDPEYFRTFAQTILQKSFSSKSITLNFTIFPGWFILLRFLLGFLSGLKNRLVEIVLFSQMIIVAYFFLRRYFRPHTIAHMRALALQEHALPVIQPHEIVLQQHDLMRYENYSAKQKNPGVS
ncbi:MAG: hypothetical protein WC489_04215 [Patescibacteria group bacterium]